MEDSLIPGSLCKVNIDFFDSRCNFVGIFLEIDSAEYPWYRVKFLHDNIIEDLLLIKREISQCIEVIHEVG